MSTIAEQIAYFRNLTNEYVTQTLQNIAYYRDVIANQIKLSYAWAISLYTSGWLKAQALWLFQMFMKGFRYGYQFVFKCLDLLIAIRNKLIHLIQNLPRYIIEFSKELYQFFKLSFIHLIKMSKEVFLALKDALVSLLNHLGTFINKVVLPFLSKIAEKVFARVATAIGVVFGISSAMVDISFDLLDLLYKNTLGLVLPAIPSTPLLATSLVYLKGALTVGLVGGACYGIYVGCKKAYPHLKKIYDKGILKQADELLENTRKRITPLQPNPKVDNLFVRTLGVAAFITIYFMIQIGQNVNHFPPEAFAFCLFAGGFSGLVYLVCSPFMKEVPTPAAQAPQRRTSRLPSSRSTVAPDGVNGPTITPLREERRKSAHQEKQKAIEPVAPRKARRHQVA